MEVLLITAPDPDGFDNPLVERNPRKIAQWLDQLPLLNPVETVSQLLEALQPLNRQTFSDKERLRLLELYQRAVNAVFNAFTRRSLRQVPVPAVRRERIKNDVARLCLELAGGYKGLILQAHQQGRTAAQEPMLLQAAYRAMEQLAHVLLHSFRIYGPIPPRVFLEIHQLYAWVERAGACDTPVDLQQHTDTLGALYRRILLLCCADPARLGEDEVLRVYALLERYAPHCRIISEACSPPYEGRFSFDLYYDAPPRPCVKLDAPSRSTQPRVLDATAVAAAVRAQAQAETGTTADEERRLLRLLLPQLESTAQRAAPRHAVQRPALIAAGIATIHYYLANPRRLALGVAQARQGIMVQHIDTTAGDEDDRGLDAWDACNESDTGYMLRRTQRHSAVRVGELLGVLFLDNESAAGMELAVVRWMRTGTDSALEIGVERVSGTAAAVRCQRLSDSDAPQQHGLFLPSSDLHDLPATLVVPKRFYARGQRLSVEVGAKTIVVEAGHLVMDTACFDRFVFHAQREDPAAE